MSYPPLVQKLIEEFQKLPGVGAKTAERLVFHLLKAPAEEVLGLANAIRNMTENVKKCRYCFNITDQDPCPICSDPRRDTSTVCVLEQPKDLIAIEKTGSHRGLYHVLMGRVAPLDNEHPESLTVDHLVRRIADSKKSDHPIAEIIIATNPNFEGDTTAMYIIDKLKPFSLRISRIARGIPSGSSIEFASQAILADALTERKMLVTNDTE